jgi:type VI secretion system secreted protein Hcp
MAVDMFINMGPNIKGETQDDAQKAKNDIDVVSWSWGMSQAGTGHMGGGGGAGKVSVQDLSFTKFVDTATPALQLHCATGKHIPKCVVLVRKAGGTQQKYVEITLEDVLVTSVQTGASGGEERLHEQVSLNFVKVAFEYFVQGNDGNTKSAGSFKYNIAASKQL